MDLKNMTPKDKELYEIAMERKEYIMKSLEDGEIPLEFDEIINHISRAEYRRGKSDGSAEFKDNGSENAEV